MAQTMAAQSARCDDLGDERLVDLDLVEREHAQIAERRIAGAEIVEHDARRRARRSRCEDGDVAGVLLQQHRFGDLELQPFRRQAGVGQRVADDHLDQVAAAELHRRQVDRELDRAPATWPRRRRRWRRIHSPSGMIRPISSASGMKRSGGISPCSRVAPAHQRLGAAGLLAWRCRPSSGSGARTRRAPARCAGRPRGRAAGAPRASISGSKKRIAVASFGLRPVEREVGILAGAGWRRRRPSARCAMPMLMPMTIWWPSIS